MNRADRHALEQEQAEHEKTKRTLRLVLEERKVEKAKARATAKTKSMEAWTPITAPDDSEKLAGFPVDEKRDLADEQAILDACHPKQREFIEEMQDAGVLVKDDSGFSKGDQGKPRPDLMPTGFAMEMGRVMANGAAKYGVDNWQKCDDPRRYEAAAMRHLLAYIDGEELDPDSGQSHLAHCACSLAMRFGLKERQ